jgi:hypothetical protein
MKFTNEFMEKILSMPNPKIAFSQLQQSLIGIGFSLTKKPYSLAPFASEPPGGEVVLLIDRSPRIVLKHHQRAVRPTHDAKSLMDRD